MKKLTFIPQLDSFRFFAVFLVMVYHWLPSYAYLPWGAYGVTFFFALSGFLISSNLFYLKQSIDNQEITTPGALKQFYVRRTLRIFPLYYLVIILSFVFIRDAFSGHVGWYLAYIPNFLFAREKSWPELLSHFWSLGVEEQFYLLWPSLIFFVRWDRLKYLFLFVILFSIVMKLGLFLSHGSLFNLLLPWNSLDAFGTGALLAYLPFSRYRTTFLDRIPFRWGFFLSLGLGILSDRTGYFFLFDLFISISAIFIIRQAQKGFTGFAGKVFDFPALQYLGKISYGLYVYHVFMPWLWRCLTGRELRLPLPITIITGNWAHRPLVIEIAQFLLTVIISSLSWYLLEKPFINLARRKARPSLVAVQ